MMTTKILNPLLDAIATIVGIDWLDWLSGILITLLVLNVSPDWAVLKLEKLANSHAKTFTLSSSAAASLVFVALNTAMQRASDNDFFELQEGKGLERQFDCIRATIRRLVLLSLVSLAAQVLLDPKGINPHWSTVLLSLLFTTLLGAWRVGFFFKEATKTIAEGARDRANEAWNDDP